MPSVKRRVCEVIKKDVQVGVRALFASYKQLGLEYNQHFINCRHRDGVCSIDPFPHLQRFGMINDNAPASPTSLSGCYSAVFLYLVRWKVR